MFTFIRQVPPEAGSQGSFFIVIREFSRKFVGVAVKIAVRMSLLFALLSPQKGSEQTSLAPSAPEAQRIKDEPLLQLLIQAYQRAAAKGKSDWVSIQQLGTTLQQLQPGFASKTYGFPKLKGLIQNYPQVFQTRSLKGGQIELQAKIQR